MCGVKIYLTHISRLGAQLTNDRVLGNTIGRHRHARRESAKNSNPTVYGSYC
ncbi:hypothetical protein MCGE09_00160 [Thaumarchaeota archaeon SCGC AB-539-E09]|nr:hypothetical protein MCGE09_00160 [Thaumarchaeota archaeon SCGC AB-539-E09]